MARWKLVNAHYLNCVGTEWEYNEVDRTTGRQVRMRLPVPRHLNPYDPSDWTNRWGNKDNEEGEIVVCHAGKGEPKDVVFQGDPTPDMVPIDDEAKAISGSFTELWRYKPEVDAPGGFSQSMVDKFQSQFAELQSKPSTVPGLEDLAKAVAAIAKQNQDMLQSLVKPDRRV